MKRFYGRKPEYAKRQRRSDAGTTDYGTVVEVPRAVPSYARRGYFTSRTGYRNFRRSYSNVRYGGYLGQEKKYLDTYGTGSIVANDDMTGAEIDPVTVNCLNAVAQGDGATNRDGNKYAITEIHIKGAAFVQSQTNQTAADQPPQVFFALVQDKQTNAAQLNSEDVYTNPASGTTIGQGNPFRNIQFSKRFKVIRTLLMNIPPGPITYDGTNIEQAGSRCPFEFYVKLKKPIYVECKGTSANVTDIVDNSLHMIAVQESDQTTYTVSYFYNSRIRFYG